MALHLDTAAPRGRGGVPTKVMPRSPKSYKKTTFIASVIYPCVSV